MKTYASHGCSYHTRIVCTGCKVITGAAINTTKAYTRCWFCCIGCLCGAALAKEGRQHSLRHDIMVVPTFHRAPSNMARINLFACSVAFMHCLHYGLVGHECGSFVSSMLRHFISVLPLESLKYLKYVEFGASSEMVSIVCTGEILEYLMQGENHLKQIHSNMTSMYFCPGRIPACL